MTRTANSAGPTATTLKATPKLRAPEMTPTETRPTTLPARPTRPITALARPRRREEEREEERRHCEQPQPGAMAGEVRLAVVGLEAPGLVQMTSDAAQRQHTEQRQREQDPPPADAQVGQGLE